MTPPIDPARAARIELGTPFRYHLLAPTVSESPLARAWNALVDAFERALSHVPGAHGAAMTLTWLVAALALAACAIALVRVLPIFSAARRRRDLGVATMRAERDDARLTRAAFAAADRGETTLAVRLLLRAAIALLGTWGVLDDDAGATVSDLRRAVCDTVLAEPFNAIASAYVTGVYAQRPLDSAAWNRARGGYEALHASARR